MFLFQSSLPALLTQIPPSGKKCVFPKPEGSADAFYLAQLATLARRDRRMLCVVLSEAYSALRLRDELRALMPDAAMALFPDWETLPYDAFSPHQDLISERLLTLYGMIRKSWDVVLITASTALQRLSPVSHLAAHTFYLKCGEKVEIAALRAQLALAGYAHVAQVVAPGEFAVRGGLIDLFPMGATAPCRLDFFDDTLETIKTFDVDTQRTMAPLTEIRMLPAREYPLTEEARLQFRQAFREHFEGNPAKSGLYKSISSGGSPAGLEYYLPLFFKETATFSSYLPDDAIVFLEGGAAHAQETFWAEIRDRYRLLRGDVDRPLLPPEKIYCSVSEATAMFDRFARATFANQGDSPFHPLPNITIDRRARDPFASLKVFIDDCAAQKLNIVLLAQSAGRRETMNAMFKENGIQFRFIDDTASPSALPPLGLGIAPLAHGFVWQDARLAVLTENDLYADRKNEAARRRLQRKSTVEIDQMIRNLAEMRVGDLVVHEDHGIGRYLGLVTLNLDHGTEEFLHLEYADNALLYVPVSDLHVVSRYSGASPEHVTLHSLGSAEWSRARQRAKKKAFDTAAELLNVYARRAARQGTSFVVDERDLSLFAEGFPFETTPDQQTAIDAVLSDLAAPQPMDRLVCGDVGFGKTEVALRAAFAVVHAGYQVALLAPTTLLVEQHYKVFTERFSELPVKIAELSRFKTQEETKKTLAGMANGTVDLIIGTHRLIQNDVRFKNLGLIIVDEEHRFGVRQKEQLKKWRAEVDVLTLTATPIPRTLSMSLEGLREISVIATAPEKRLAIKTFVFPYSFGVIHEAIRRELNRGGQVYFLHNDIASLQEKADRIAELMPEARVAVAHGQMPERQLESVMRDFYQQRINVLFCSTIIETGIDVPTANTIVIDRADKFGLAQLHQLRGRVGRSHHQAYAYLLTPPEESLTAQAKQRLEAICRMEQLGSGFYLAMHDLEIRGAGEILGDKQSGEMIEVGFELYADLLKHAVNALKEGRELDLDAPLHVTTEIHLQHAALLPESYCDNVHERLVLYKRLTNAQTLSDVDALHEELVDRFGLLPNEGKALLACHRLRLMVKPFGVTRLDADANSIVLTFQDHPPFDPMILLQLIGSHSKISFKGAHKIKLDCHTDDADEVVLAVRTFLDELKS
ncbi:MAG: transcription-repair coupling factor [Burkholderiales bacterium]|jgi:transcription-repair coupling factor (superfamily II helicase)|nr:transcription-repair coupling factor [Burkholderiales bacterium]